MTSRSSSSSISRSGLPWLLVFGLLAVVLVLSVGVLVPPPPLGRDSPAERFSEGRARDVVHHLTEGIGKRVNGTEGYAKAAEYLAAQLHKMPGVEVESYQGSGTYIHRLFPASPIVYRNTNVLGRLPGKTRDAILLDAHFDTLPDSVGAADDAAGVACILEALRVLVREAPLDRTIVVNLNGGEEMGLLGAAAFLKHPWAKDVRAYVYLEALPSGRAFLIGAGPNNPWLAKTYAHAVAAPLGSVLGQELALSGLLPFNGDFLPFHAAGLVGLDVAMVGDAARVHTDLDRLDGLESGSLQHMGDATLAATRALASKSTQLGPDPRSVVYYDLLGFTMLVYPQWVGRLLGASALLLFALLLSRGRARRLLSLRSVLAACAWNGLGVVAGLFAALLPALALKMLLHRSIGWFSAPSLLLLCSALPAAAGMLFVHHAWRSRAMRKMAGDADRVALTAWTGSLLFWAFWLLLATLAGAGAGYLAFYWVAGGALGLMLYPRARLAGAILGLLPGAIVTIETATMLCMNIAPMSGMVPASVPADLVIIVLCGISTALVGVVAFTLPCRTGGAGKMAIVCAVLGAVGIALTAAHSPYSSTHPKRLVALHAADAEKSALLLGSTGADGMDSLLSLFPNAKPAPATWPSVMGKPITHMLPAPVPSMPAPRADVTAEHYDHAADARQVTLHLHGTSSQLLLSIPAKALLGWSASPRLVALRPTESQYHVNFEGVPSGGVDIQLTLRGSRPVEVDLRGIDGAPASGPEIESVRRRLPDWVTLTSYSYRMARLKL
jgi:hypothetical protein